MIIISNVHEACGNDTDRTYILDKVSIKPREAITRIRKLLHKLARIPTTAGCKAKPNSTPDWANDKTHYSAKKTRRLSYTPTDETMPSP